MKQAFKASWKRSVQARKQRKFMHNAPLHIKSTLLHAPLSKELKEKHGKRNIRVRVGDEVEVLRGDHKGKKGLVDHVNVEKLTVLVRGVERVKREGAKVPHPVTVSNVRITKLVTDKRRI